MKQARVIYISPDHLQASLNVGSNDGISMGDRFLIYTLSEHEILDPETNESLGFLELVKGTGKVIHLQEKMCTIESDMYNDFSTKTITRKQGSPSLSAFYGSTVTEEVIPNRKHLKFKNVSEDDYAKLV